MLKYFYSLFLCYFLLIFSCLCYATEQSKLEEAIKYYDSGEYKRSIAVYNELLDKSFTSGSLYYNLGNAYFRDKQIGNAVASYLAARFKLPRNPDIKENLKYSLLQVPDNLDDKLAPSLWSVLDFWSAYLTSVELLSFALLLWSLGFLCLFILNFFPKLILFRKLAWPLITLSLPLFFIFQISYLNHKEWGAIVSKVATAHSGPGEKNTVVFELHEGAPLVIKDKKGSWYKILLSNDKKGWVSEKAIKLYSQDIFNM